MLSNYPKTLYIYRTKKADQPILILILCALCNNMLYYFWRCNMFSFFKKNKRNSSDTEPTEPEQRQNQTQSHYSIQDKLEDLELRRYDLYCQLPTSFSKFTLPLPPIMVSQLDPSQTKVYFELLRVENEIISIRSKRYCFPRPYVNNSLKKTPELTDKIKEYIHTYSSPQKPTAPVNVSSQIQETTNEIQYSIRENANDRQYSLREKPERHIESISAFDAWKSKLHREYDSFSSLLLHLISEQNISNAEFYKRASLDRKTFSKIINESNYHPSKATVLLCCIGLQLSEEEAEFLLKSAGYALSLSDDYDLVIRYCLENSIYNPMDIDELLYEITDKTLISRY